MMQIPKQFKLFGETITIEWDKHLIQQDSEVGQAKYRDGKIIIQPSTESMPIPQVQLEQTFFHELVHHILMAINETDLCHNEQFVELFAKLFHQSIVTAEYDDESA